MSDRLRARTQVQVLGRTIAVAVLAGCFLSSGRADAKPGWDQVANITAAAQSVAQLQIAHGALGTYQAIVECYETHQLASKLSAALEGCMVRDYIHSKITATVYTRLPLEKRAEMSLPEPEKLILGMKQRVSAAFLQYKGTERDVSHLVALIDKHGLPAYSKARFPNGGGEGDLKP